MKHGRKQKGMMALMFTITILAIIIIITLFTARVIVTDNKIFNNEKNNADALNAAQAGFDYALGYLNVNPFLVVTGLGYCASASTTYSLTSGTLANGATYTMTFSCITAGSFITFNLSATGTSQDGTATRTVSATLKQYCGVSLPLITRSTAVVGAASAPVVTNQDSGATRTISAGGTVTLSNSGSATTATGGNYNCAANYPPASPAGTCLNITANSGLGSLSQTVEFPQLYLGRILTDFSSLATAGYNLDCTAGGNKIFSQITTIASHCTGGPGGGATLSGQTGKIIYMNMGSDNLTLTNVGIGGFTLGTAEAPVILVVVGTGTVTLNTAGALAANTIYGNIYSQGDVTIDDNATSATTVNGLVFGEGSVLVRDGAIVNGAVVANTATIQDTATAPGNVVYNSTGASYIGNTLQHYCGGSYGVVSGSWKDF